MSQIHNERYERRWSADQRVPAINDARASVASGRSAAENYSLDEAGRIRRMVSDLSGPVICPACGDRLSGVRGRRGDQAVMLLVCNACGRGLVLWTSE